MKTVIGIAGVKTAGKDTAAEMVKEIVEADQHALADKLKNVCASAFGIPRSHFDDQSIKEVPFDTPKKLSLSSIQTILNQFSLNPSVEDLNCKLSKVIDMELPSPRVIAQIVGTEVLRAYGGEDIHCLNLPLNSEVTIVSDLRFPNEYNYFARNSDVAFIPLYIFRKEAEDKITPDSHSSETSVFEFKDKCMLVDNNGDLNTLRANIHNIIRKVYLNE